MSFRVVTLRRMFIGKYVLKVSDKTIAILGSLYFIKVERNPEMKALVI